MAEERTPGTSIGDTISPESNFDNLEEKNPASHRKIKSGVPNSNPTNSMLVSLKADKTAN